MRNQRLQIAYLTNTEARDKRSWSGTHYYMAQALEKNVGDIHYLGPAIAKRAIFTGKLLSLIAQKILKKRYNYFHSRRMALSYSAFFSKKLNQGEYDLVFAPASSSGIAFIKTRIPIVYNSDTTFSNMLDYSPAYSNLLNISIDQGMEIERRALQNASLSLYPSSWAANSAIKDFQTSAGKVHIIPFGANTDIIPSRDMILGKRKNETCRLLFLGVNWERKGGAIAFETLIELLKQNIPAELTVCGCIPPPQFNHKNVKVIPFLNKNLEKDQQAFYDLLLHSDILILPSRNECAGIVFSEAAAFGLPSVATNTGGIPGMIKDGENGFLLPLSADGKDFANTISTLFKDDEKYLSMVKRARDMYETTLNWDSWAKEISRLIQPLVN